MEIPHLSGSSKRAKAPTNPNQKVVVSCLVDECNSDLSQCREYHRRHKVCEPHSKTPIVTISGRPQRFCQQCSRFHSLEEFDEGKRSCRKRLDGHNRRRRKPQSDSLAKTTSGLFFSTPQGTRVLSFDNPQVLANSQDYAPPLVHGYKEMNQFRFTQGSATTSTNNTSNTTHDRGYKEMNKLMFCDGANGAGNSSSDHALSLLSSMPTSHSRDVGSSLVIPHAQSTMPTTNGRDLGSSHVGPHARSSQFEGVGQMLLPCYEEMENNGVVSDEESSGSRRSHNTNTNITLHF